MQNEKICMAAAWQIAYFGQPNIEQNARLS
jgi:hypothetical protein